MANYVNLHTQLASIMEVLANAAVAEICQLVDDGFSALRLEVSRGQRENLALKSKLRLMEVRGSAGVRCGGGGGGKKRVPVPPPPLVVTCGRKEKPAGAKGHGKPITLGTAGAQFTVTRPVGAEPPVEPEVVMVKEEKLEDERRGCMLDGPQEAPSGSNELGSRSLPAEDDLPLRGDASLSETETPRISLSGHYETEDFAEAEGPQRQGEEEEEEEEVGEEEEEEEAGEDEEGEADNLKIQQADGGYSIYGGRSQVPDQNHRSLARFSGPHGAKELADSSSSSEEGTDVGDVDTRGSSPAAESSPSKVLDAETPLVKTLETDVPLTDAGVSDLCGAAADWKREAVEGISAPVKMEEEMQPSWSEAFRTTLPFVPVQRKDRDDVQMNSSKLMSSNNHSNSFSSQRHHRESESAESKSSELDAGGFDSSSFDELFSSPEVARSLIAPVKDSADDVGGIDERLSSSFPFLTCGTSFGNASSSTSVSVADASFRNPPSGSRSRGFLTNPERVFSCQQCGRLFTNSRDLVVHQRSHAGERLFHCPLCKKPFLHLHQLKTHQRVHTGEKPFSCTQCGKRFSQSSHIKRHMSVHTGEKRYSCSLCGKRFSQACSLKVHQAVHTGERPYSCTQCGKSFSVLGNLVRHQSVHIGK